MPITEIALLKHFVYKQQHWYLCRHQLLKRRSLMSSLHLKCHLRDMAIAALPSELQQHARTNDYTAFPKNRELPKEFIAIDEGM